MGSTTERRVRRPNATPQLVARLASLLLAVTAEPGDPPALPPENVFVVDTLADEFRGVTWYEVVRRRFMRLDIPSVGDSSGEGRLDSCGRSAKPMDGDTVATACSEIAVVATAFAIPGAPPNGIRPPENLDDVDALDAREPGRKYDGPCGVCAWDTDPVCVGEGGGRGDAAGDGVLGRDAGMNSSDISGGGACASKRDNDDGPAVGEELARVRTGNRRDVGGRVALNASSTSFSGGPGGKVPGSWSGGLGIGGLGIGGLVDSLISDGFLPDSRRFVG